MTKVLLSIENLIIYGVGIGYLTAVWVYCPEYYRLVFPMALETYSAYQSKGGWIFFSAQALFVFGVTFADFRLRHNSPYRRDIFYLVGLCPAFLCYALMNNGWGYSYNPLISIILVTTGWVGWEFRYLCSQNSSDRSFLFGLRACVLNLLVNAMLIVVPSVYALETTCGDYFECGPYKPFFEVLKEDSPSGSFGTITLDFTFWTHLAKAPGASWQTRYNTLWMMPMFFKSDDVFAKEHQWILDYVATGFAADLNDHKPGVVFVDRDADLLGKKQKVYLPRYLEKVPAFAFAWNHYRYDRTLSIPDARPGSKGRSYDVFKRIP